MITITPERRAELRAAVIEDPSPMGSVWWPISGPSVMALLGAADERDRLAAAVERVRALAEWHETKAMKARRFRPEIDGENRVMDKTAEVHDDAARRVRRALDGPEDLTS